MAELHLSAAHADSVRGILRAHLPAATRVRAFGSRATGKGLKRHSDLDLLIDSADEIPLSVVADLREALSESDLPFTVDLLQRQDATAAFMARIESEGLADLT